MAAVVVLLGSCHGGGSSTAADAAVVRAANLQPADLPPEWTASPAPDPVSNEGDRSRYAQCVGRPDPKAVRTATVDSAQFQVDDSSRVVATVQTARTAAIADQDFDALEGNRGLPCMRPRVQGELDRHTVPGRGPTGFTVERLPGLRLGDRTVAFRAAITYPKGAGPADRAYDDQVNVLQGRLEVTAWFFNAGQPPSPALEQAVLTNVLNRAATARKRAKG